MRPKNQLTCQTYCRAFGGRTPDVGAPAALVLERQYVAANAGTFIGSLRISAPLQLVIYPPLRHLKLCFARMNNSPVSYSRTSRPPVTNSNMATGAHAPSSRPYRLYPGPLVTDIHALPSLGHGTITTTVSSCSRLALLHSIPVHIASVESQPHPSPTLVLHPPFSSPPCLSPPDLSPRRFLSLTVPGCVYLTFLSRTA